MNTNSYISKIKLIREICDINQSMHIYHAPKKKIVNNNLHLNPFIKQIEKLNTCPTKIKHKRINFSKLLNASTMNNKCMNFNCYENFCYN